MHVPYDAFMSRHVVSMIDVQSLSFDLAILLDMNMLVGLENADLVLRELDTEWGQKETSRVGADLREALDQGEFVLDLAAVGLGLVLGLGELLRRRILLECDLVLSAAMTHR